MLIFHLFSSIFQAIAEMIIRIMPRTRKKIPYSERKLNNTLTKPNAPNPETMMQGQKPRATAAVPRAPIPALIPPVIARCFFMVIFLE